MKIACNYYYYYSSINWYFFVCFIHIDNEQTTITKNNETKVPSTDHHQPLPCTQQNTKTEKKSHPKIKLINEKIPIQWMWIWNLYIMEARRRLVVGYLVEWIFFSHSLSLCLYVNYGIWHISLWFMFVNLYLF